MIEYPKIANIFKRDNITFKAVEGLYTNDTLAYLKDNQWLFTEKVDGTNIRIIWWSEPFKKVEIKGRTGSAIIPKHLLMKLEEVFPVALFEKFYPTTMITLYGEGFGYKINSGGKYLGKEVDFVLFDVKIGNGWLERKEVEDIAKKLNIAVMPIVGQGTLANAVQLVSGNLQSNWGNFEAEGIVARPLIELCDRRGDRIITKIKARDFSNLERK